MEKRLVTLEERYSAAEHELRELSGVVWEQARTIARLEARVARLEERSRATDDGGGPIPHEKPPHF